MKRTDTDWRGANDLINEKYQMQYVENTYECLKKMEHRTVQLSTIAKLTTDNSSIIHDFPIEGNTYGIDPYREYTIKVCDTYGATLYVLVKSRPPFVYLLPIVSGFQTHETCTPLKPTENWRIRNLKEFKLLETQDASAIFGVHAIMLVINATNGIYGENGMLQINPTPSFLSTWKESEMYSLKDGVTVTSSAALVLQVWLHTMLLWKHRCIDRKVTIKKSGGSTIFHASSDDFLHTKHHTIIDINKEIVVYINEGKTHREFTGFHQLESQRCGHFRHLKSGKITYIPPTIVHYKKIAPNVMEQQMGIRKVTYRNTEDFLREKSYLENEVCLALQGKNISYKREAMFDWLGRKRLDFYLPEKGVAIECQGVQHFYPYGSKDKDLAKRQQRDADKYQECTEHQIKVLYYVSPDIPIPEELAKKYTYYTDLQALLHEFE